MSAMQRDELSDSDEASCENAYRDALKATHAHADAAIEAAKKARKPEVSRFMRLMGFSSAAAPVPAPSLDPTRPPSVGLNGTSH